ncbi:hypothetical protein IW261DRAFT_1444537, partial [Armillaria novae-zelandiae]
MSFHDGVPIGSILDEIDVQNIITLLNRHEISVGPSIANNREYLYYFIGNCNDVLKDAFRHEVIRCFHGIEHLCLKLPMLLLLYMVKTQDHDASVGNHYTRKELWNRLDNFYLENVIRNHALDTLDPKFVDGSSVGGTLREHHKDVIVDALRLSVGVKDKINTFTPRH